MRSRSRGEEPFVGGPIDRSGPSQVTAFRRPFHRLQVTGRRGPSSASQADAVPAETGGVDGGREGRSIIGDLRSESSGVMEPSDGFSSDVINREPLWNDRMTRLVQAREACIPFYDELQNARDDYAEAVTADSLLICRSMITSVIRQLCFYYALARSVCHIRNSVSF